MTSFGAVDLFSGSNSASGTNKFSVDKNPMNQLDEGVEDVIGQQAQRTGGVVTGGFNSVIDTVLGTGAAPDPNGGSLNQLASYNQDNLAFNGMQSPAAGSGPQSPGTGGFDLFGSIINFVLNLLNPTNLLTPMDPTTQQAYPNNIPPLDASKVTSGTFPQSMLSIVAIPAEIITRVLSAFLTPLVPVSSVANTNPNLLSNPNFTSSVSVDGQGIWTWDGTVTRTADGSGSVKVTADGTPKSLLTDPVIPVAAGQSLACSIYLEWTGLAGVGATMNLSLVSYLGTAIAATTVLNSVLNPTTDAGWTMLQGSYTVPSSGVDGIRLQLNVLPAATAGTVNWDDGSVTKTQLMAESWTAGLPGDLNNLNTNVDSRALSSDVQNMANTMADGTYYDIGTALTPMSNRMQGLGATGLIGANYVPGLDATKITSGILAISSVPTGLLGISNIADIQTLTNYITNTLVGVSGMYTGSTLNQANSSMFSLYNNMLNNTQAIQAMQVQARSALVSGVSVSVDFANYPDGPLPSNFTVTYTGTGTSKLGIKGGLAGWFPLNNDGNRQAYAIWNTEPTNTDYQRVSGAMNSAPGGASTGGTPYMYALGRVDNPNNPQNFVWGRAYNAGFLTYEADLGCTVAGVETIWVSGVALTWSTNMMVVFGAQGNPRRYQVFSGTQLVLDYIEAGTASQLGPGYRNWGAKNTCVTGPSSGGTIAGTAVADNAPPPVVGSTFRVYRLSTGTVNFAVGPNPNSYIITPAGFFDTLDFCSPDLTWDGLYQLTISVEGTYAVSLRYNSNQNNGQFAAAIIKNNVGVRAMGGTGTYSGFGAQAPTGEGCTALIYLKAGDVISPGYQNGGVAFGAIGDPSGGTCYFEVALVNRSMS